MSKRLHDDPCKVLANLWDTRAHGDATITCEGQTFTVHRGILSAASPVFAACFRNDMVEGISANIEIRDSQAEAVEAMLRYIYTSNIDSSTAPAVLLLAHRYQIETLVGRCAEVLLE